MEDFIKERNEVLVSLDKERIIEYSKKHKIAIPENEKVFWAGIHKAICNIFVYGESDITLEQYDRSYVWLRENGFSPVIGDDY